MNLLDIFIGANAFTAWLLYLLLSYCRPKHNYREALWWVLGVVGLALLGALLMGYGLALSGGYLREQLIYYSRSNSLIPAFMLFELAVTVIAAMSISQRMRDKLTYRKVTLTLIVLYLIGSFGIYGYNPFGYATSVIPGWHTTIYELGNFYGVLIWLGVMFLLLLARHKGALTH